MGKGGWDLEVEMAGHAMPDGLEVLEVAESTGTAASALDDAVDGLDRGGGDAVGEVSEDALPVALDGLCQLLEWSQTAAHRPGAPRFEVEPGAGRSGPGPGVLQVLAQRHGPGQFLVPGTEILPQL